MELGRTKPEGSFALGFLVGYILTIAAFSLILAMVLSPVVDETDPFTKAFKDSEEETTPGPGTRGLDTPIPLYRSGM